MLRMCIKILDSLMYSLCCQHYNGTLCTGKDSVSNAPLSVARIGMKFHPFFQFLF